MGFLTATVIALPAGCNRNERTTEVKYDSPSGDHDLKLKKSTKWDNDSSKTEYKAKIEHDKD